MDYKRMTILLIALLLIGSVFSCSPRVHPAPQATTPAATLAPASPIVMQFVTPVPTPTMSPSPTPSPEPTGRALRAWQLQQEERATLLAHPPENGDIEATLTSLKIDPDKKLIALTFDDGPSNQNTNRILDVLEQYNARATFFIIGKRIQNHEEVIARAISLNCEIGSHTWGHSDFTKYPKSALIDSLEKVDEAMMTNFGYKMTLFRPPYAAINKDVEAASAQMGYTMVLWSGSSHDWSIKDVDKIYKNCFHCAADGAIVLFHDIYPFTADAIERIVPELINEGYQLVTVSELIAMDENSLKPDARYGGWADSVSVEY
ncbi:MAG: polysaccharide deacetylase family protein [Clostridiales bacterium]|nr:polysaccharide deacetylase family protein [Clostridiales bacterium]